MVFLVRGRGAENIKKRRKQREEKTLKTKEKEKRRIQEKSNNNKKHLWFHLLYKSYIFLGNIVRKKVVHTMTFYLQFLCVAGYLKHSIM